MSWILREHGLTGVGRIAPASHVSQEAHARKRAAAIRTGRGVLDRQRLGSHGQDVHQVERHGDQHGQPIAIDLTARMGESVMADFLKAARQDVLQEAADELLSRDCHPAILRAPALAVGISDPAQVIRTRLDLYDPAIADRHAEDIGRQVLQCSPTVTDGLAVDNPSLGPDLGGNLRQQARLLHRRLELGAINDRRGSDGDEEVDSAGKPGLKILTDCSTRHDEVDVRMVAQVSSPRVQNARESQLARTEVLGIPSQFNQRRCGRVEHRPIGLAWPRTHEPTKLLRHGERDQEVGTGQEFFELRLEPLFGLMPLTNGTMPIPARTRHEMLFGAGLAAIEDAPEFPGSTAFEHGHDFQLVLAHAVCVLLAVGRSVLAEDLTNCRSNRQVIRRKPLGKRRGKGCLTHARPRGDRLQRDRPSRR